MIRLKGEIFKYELCICDSIIGWRIDKMIDKGELIVVSDDDSSHHYRSNIKENLMKNRYIVFFTSIILLTICVIVSNEIGINEPIIHIVGAYASVILISVILYKAPFHLFALSLAFDVFALGTGTILDLYGTIDCYDRVVHFVSGILLAEMGRLLILFLYKKYNVPSFHIFTLLFCVTFSFACAALWEVYEFTADQLLHLKMQGNNLNTMGDIVSGILGGLLYGIGYSVWLIRNGELKRKFTDN